MCTTNLIWMLVGILSKQLITAKITTSLRVSDSETTVPVTVTCKRSGLGAHAMCFEQSQGLDTILCKNLRL